MPSADASEDLDGVVVTVRYGTNRLNLFTVGPGDLLHDRYLQTRRLYEADVLESCASLHFPGASIVDVGANIGNHTLFFAKVLGARVHAFEPNPVSRALLLRSLAGNGCHSLVEVIPAAAGAAQGTGHILPGREGNVGGEARFIAGEGGIPQVRIDEVVPIGTPISIIKVDVEGMEVPALAGAEKLLARWLPYVVVEANNRHELYKLLRYLSSYGYVLQRKYFNKTYLLGVTDQFKRQANLLAALEAVQAP